MNNQKNGFSTLIWGPPLWTSFHIISFNYPLDSTEEDKENYARFLISIKHILPCKFCRENYSKNVAAAGLNVSVLNSRENFSRFFYRLHNVVNKMLGKPKYKTYEKVRAQYEQFRARDCDKQKQLIESGCFNNLYPMKCQLSLVPKDEEFETLRVSNTSCAKCRKNQEKNSNK